MKRKKKNRDDNIIIDMSTSNIYLKQERHFGLLAKDESISSVIKWPKTVIKKVKIG